MKSTLLDKTFEPEISFPEWTTCWILSDGKAGNNTITHGVADQLKLQAQIKQIKAQGMYNLLAPYCRPPAKDRPGGDGGLLNPPWPDIAIGCGRLTAPYIRALRNISGQTFTTMMLDPKTGPKTAHLFWVPQHDKRRGENVITTITSPHRFSPELLEAQRKTLPESFAKLIGKRIAILIGGPNRDYRYSALDAGRLISLISDIAALPDVCLMITASRRSPGELMQSVDFATKSANRFFWHNGGGDNPYPQILAHADAFVVTADSVNMVGEAGATGKPVHIFHPSGGSAKFNRFHQALTAAGVTRKITSASQVLEDWTYEPLYSATEIAREIAQRYTRWKQGQATVADDER